MPVDLESLCPEAHPAASCLDLLWESTAGFGGSRAPGGCALSTGLLGSNGFIAQVVGSEALGFHPGPLVGKEWCDTHMLTAPATS